MDLVSCIESSHAAPIKKYKYTLLMAWVPPSFLEIPHGDPVTAAGSKGRVEPASPREKRGGVSWVVSTPRSLVPASLH